MPFQNEEVLKKLRCPFMAGAPCMGRECGVFRWGSQVNSATGQRSAYCGAGSERGSYILAPSRAQGAQAATAQRLPKKDGEAAPASRAERAESELI